MNNGHKRWAHVTHRLTPPVVQAVPQGHGIISYRNCSWVPESQITPYYLAKVVAKSRPRRIEGLVSPAGSGAGFEVACASVGAGKEGVGVRLDQNAACGRGFSQFYSFVPRGEPPPVVITGWREHETVLLLHCSRFV